MPGRVNTARGGRPRATGPFRRRRSVFFGVGRLALAGAGRGPGAGGGEGGLVLGEIAGLAGAVDGHAVGLGFEDGVAAGVGDGFHRGRVARVADAEDGAGDGAPLDAVAAAERLPGFLDVVLERAELAGGPVDAVLPGGTGGGDGEEDEEEGELGEGHGVTWGPEAGGDMGYVTGGSGGFKGWGVSLVRLGSIDPLA